MARSRFDCVHQGIGEGWSDLYHKWLDCQWIDVTDVPNGDYTLSLTVNENRVFREVSYENNNAMLPVTVGGELREADVVC